METFLSSITAEILFKIIKYMKKNNYRSLWIDREEHTRLGFKKKNIINENEWCRYIFN